MKANKLAQVVRHAIIWHDQYARSPGKRFRGAPKGESRTRPYGIHPVWATMTILHELALPEKLRETGAEVLLYHDIREDTTAQFPKSISKRIIRFVEMMTFASFDEEVTLLWEQPPEIRLFKLYDKVSNWMDGAWMYPERRIIHREHLRKIADDVEQNFGLLNIVHIARALTKTP